MKKKKKPIQTPLFSSILFSYKKIKKGKKLIKINVVYEVDQESLSLYIKLVYNSSHNKKKKT